MRHILKLDQFEINYPCNLNGNLCDAEKAVYLMSAIDRENNLAVINQDGVKYLYRLGIVGERNRNNNANKRLTQCTNGWRKKNHYCFGDNHFRWRYSLLINFKNSYPGYLLQLIESIVRVYISENNSFEPFGPRDAFLTADGDENVCNEFRNILANHCGIALPQ